MNEFLDALWYVVPTLVVLGGAGWWGVSASRKKRPGASEPTPKPQQSAPQAPTAEPAEQTTAEPAEQTTAEQIAVDHAGGEGIVENQDAAAPVLDVPEAVPGRFARLRSRLAASGSPLGAKLLAVLSKDHLSEDDWDELEETLLLADIGAGPAGELIDSLRTQVRVQAIKDPARVKELLRTELIKLVDPSLDRSLATQRTNAAQGKNLPAVIMVVGVNGTGKTTTLGKLTRVLVAEGKSVLLGAADTFRAAAADQLETWGARVGVPTVRSDRDGADPASVAFDAAKTAKATDVDVLLVDTAGRLQNKTGLMDELGKIARVVEKEAPIGEVLLVLDATTGQNGLNQARVFAQVAGVTGIVLTKLDGTAKGGIVVAVQRELGVPVKLVGLGEGPDDLAPFDPEQFVGSILGD